MADSFFIPDGYTEEFEIPAEAGVHPALSGKYRPALDEVRVRYASAFRRDGAEEAALRPAIVAQHVKSWSATDQNGNAAPITAETAKRLNPRLMTKLVDVVCGYTPAKQAADVGN